MKYFQINRNVKLASVYCELYQKNLTMLTIQNGRVDTFRMMSRVRKYFISNTLWRKCNFPWKGFMFGRKKINTNTIVP